MTSRRLFLSIFLAASFLFVSGCAHWNAPKVPDHWQGKELEGQVNLNDIETPRLQIIVMSADWVCNHAALRLISPGMPVIFWDPGGGLGDSDESSEYFSDKGNDGKRLFIKRSFDLVYTAPEDLVRYIDYRWQATSDELIEIFEFNLTAKDAIKLNKKLLSGENNSHQQGQFSTDAVPLMCSVATSEFLQAFMTHRIAIPASYFFPHNLSSQLYSQKPDRVLIFQRGKKPVYYQFPYKFVVGETLGALNDFFIVNYDGVTGTKN